MSPGCAYTTAWWLRWIIRSMSVAGMHICSSPLSFLNNTSSCRLKKGILSPFSMRAHVHLQNGS